MLIVDITQLQMDMEVGIILQQIPDTRHFKFMGDKMFIVHLCIAFILLIIGSTVIQILSLRKARSLIVVPDVHTDDYLTLLKISNNISRIRHNKANEIANKYYYILSFIVLLYIIFSYIINEGIFL